VQGGLAGRPLVRPPEQLQLRGPADERGVEPAGPAGRPGPHGQQPVGGLTAPATGDGHELGRLDLDGVADQAPGAAAEQDLARAGRLLQPGGQADGLPDHQRAQVGVAGHDLAGVDPGVDLQAHPALAGQPLVQLGQGGVHAGGRPDRPQGIVLVGRRDAEDGVDGVADDIDRAAVVQHDRPHGLVVADHDLGQGLGVEPLAQGGGAAEVADDHGDGLAGPAGATGPGGQGAAAGQAEPGPRRVRLPARRAADRLPRITPYARPSRAPWFRTSLEQPGASRPMGRVGRLDVFCGSPLLSTARNGRRRARPHVAPPGQRPATQRERDRAAAWWRTATSRARPVGPPQRARGGAFLGTHPCP
jgi:hypothetical protein